MSEIRRLPHGMRAPTQFHKFVTTDKDQTKLVEYRVEEIPESRYDEACRFMLEYFVPYEPKIISKNGQCDPKVLDDYHTKFMNGIKQNVSVACFKSGSDKFIGVNILEVLGRYSGTFDFDRKSKICLDIDKSIDYILDRADIFNRFNVDHYLSGTGLAINPAYCGKGIATEMIKARIAIIKALGFKVTSTGFASIGAQKAAIKAGCVTDYEISYEELAKAKDKNSDSIVEFRVQDLPEEYFEQAIEFMIKYFVPDETFCTSKDVMNKPSTLEHFKHFWQNTASEKLSIGCFKGDELFKDEDFIDIMEPMIFYSKMFDVFSNYKVDEYLTAYGLCVNPEYRGRGIATEILKARIPYMKALGLRVTSTAFTGIGSQTAAKKAGFKETFSITYADIEKKFPKFDFSKCESKYFKYMAKDKNSDSIVEYRVQDLPEEYFEQAIDFMAKYFIPHETFCVSKDVMNKPNTIEHFRRLWKHAFKDEDFLDFVGAMMYYGKMFDVFSNYKVDEYLTAYGLCVNPEYRGHGIATEILKARIPYMKALDLRVTSTAFTGIGSQTAAKKAGFKENFSITYEDIEKKFPKFDFSKCESKYLKIMAMTVE
ncbi:CLUMA_CG002402, isoform A [Clunio marinus]|uniref:CLUMA_CG002402, isoform A n=1 Tax=Clunio marinus TaxID=568069 RepID=A0A1J1HKX0_9DIPT|nr:CLUMA_CG002402, isoform A [Clunio marinus]